MSVSQIPSSPLLGLAHKHFHTIVAGLLLFTAILLRVYLYFSVQYTADDALITFRYAENLAAGNGFVYNLGERVLGTTTFLNTLLLALLIKIGFSSFAAAFLLNLCADCVTGWILLRLFSDAPPVISWAPAFVFLFSPETIQWCLSGMETEVAIALMFSALFFSSRERWVWAFVCGALAVLTRLDGIAVPVGLMICHVYRHGRLPAKPLVVLALLLLPWALFGFFYFGTPLPNSAAAKWALAEQAGQYSAIKILLRGFLHLHSFGVALLLLAALGVWSIWKQRKDLLFLPVWTGGYALSYTLASGPMHAWYFTPFYAGYITLAFWGLYRIVRNRQSLQLAAIIAVVPVVLYVSYFRIRELERNQAHFVEVNRATALWVRENTPLESTLAVKDIGYLGYYSNRRILDIAGLVSPQCIPYRAKGDFLGCIKESQPEYFAFSKGQSRNLELQENDLMQNYGRIKTIESIYGTYEIFQRLDQRSNKVK